MGQDVVTGTVTGTGSAINKVIGFQPRAVELFNNTSGDRLDWIEDMGAGAGHKLLAATGVVTILTTTGITKYVGTVGGVSEGFTIGADTDINVSAEVIMFKAYR